VLVVLGILLSVQLFLDMRLQDQLARHDLELSQLVDRPIATLIVFLLAAGYVALVSLRLSHRVAGAAHRICETLRAFRGGDRQVRATLRKGDFLEELADEVNSFLEWTAGEDGGGGFGLRDPRGPERAPRPEPRPGVSRDAPGTAGKITR
jgi:hypothetical protein